MFTIGKHIRILTFTLCGLLGAGALASAEAEVHGKHRVMHKVKAKHRQAKRNHHRSRDQRAERSLDITRIVLRVAKHAAKKNGSGEDKLAVAVLYQRAARIALRKNRVAAALWLTREARQKARQVIGDNRGEQPAGGADQAGEWKRARKSGTEPFVAEARTAAEADPAAVAEEETSEEIAEDTSEDTGDETGDEIETPTPEPTEP